MNSATSAGRSLSDRCGQERAGKWAGLLAGAVAACCAFAVPVFAADEAPAVARVEEDWVLDIGVPDTATDAPQIINVISPCGCNGVHAVFELNHRTMPTYFAGGMQLQTWISESLVDARIFPRYGKLNTADERITYTIAMSVNGETVTFEVINGTSTTWGAFGGQGYLKYTIVTPYAHLEEYSPAGSASNSRISFAAHRVRKFTLKQVRYYAADGSLISTDQTERVVHEHLATPES